jgi:hypothetical protein
MEKRTLEHLIVCFVFCFVACFVVTPLFGKKLYVYIMDYDIRIIREEKKLRKEAKAFEKRKLDRYYQTLVDEDELWRMIDEIDLDGLEKLGREYGERKKQLRR